jgi:hypothetical protein
MSRRRNYPHPAVLVPAARLTARARRLVDELETEVGEQRRVRLPRKQRFIDVDPYLVIYTGNLMANLRRAGRGNVEVDLAILLALLVRVSMTKAVLKTGKHEVGDDGTIFDVYELKVIGCIVYFDTQASLAEDIGVAQSTLKSALSALREAGIIVHSGHGYIEFDAKLVWRGDCELRDAYVEVQIKRWFDGWMALMFGSEESTEPALDTS